VFERIITATDMLGACDAAVIVALEIAKQHQGRLFVLHVLEPSYYHECGPREGVIDFKTGEEIAGSEEYKEAVKEEVDKNCGGVLKPYGNYQINIVYGRPYIEIRRWARKFGAELIVLGPHAGIQDDGLLGGNMGSTAEGVIKYVTGPVMIVNRLMPKERLNFKKIMACIDFSRSCEYAFKFATRLAQLFGSKLFIFHMSDAPSLAKLKEFCKVPNGIEHEYAIWEGTLPSVEILKYANTKDIDLIIMGSRTKEVGERVYVGSAVEQVSTKSACPVTVVTHPDALLKI
jgi:nucleotide-binding universal stress UspA family protein